MSLPPTISISTLYEAKSSSTQLSLGPMVAFWTVVLKGFLLAALFSSCRGILFACANPLFLPSVSFFFFFFLPVCVFLSSLFSSSYFFFSLSVPVLWNISSYVSDTYAKISWTAREEQQDSQLYVAYMNNRKLLSPSPPPLNTDRNFRWHHVWAQVGRFYIKIWKYIISQHLHLLILAWLLPSLPQSVLTCNSSYI